ncbi:hypothetical protein [Thermoflavifilum thermophilum]|uniref:Uncharacterized protein n=1 Tax=Thermoflavifilum thermophilum TaxID=1393122 RepID=A0A1I7N1W7_9BACT|nr:hypothetical protein [Thermoflavifilum thermophilum]SFV28623.1 hypothetical protein SAMN05660895_0373 [Thermoflavifilum thermophilum]
MLARKVILCGGLMLISKLIIAQVIVLPDFRVQAVKQGVQLQWTIPAGFPHFVRMGVQRSSDSLYNFSTIGYATPANAHHVQFTDNHPLSDSSYYKLIFVKPDGSYFFSQTLLFNGQTASVISQQEKPALSALPQSKPAVKDSASSHRPPAYHPSVYVFTNSSGNITLSLPDAAQHAYHLVFFDTTGTRVLEIPRISQSQLTLDKSNFLHAGWFQYELFDGNTLMEKWKLYVPDDVRVDSVNDASPVRQIKTRPKHRRR